VCKQSKAKQNKTKERQSGVGVRMKTHAQKNLCIKREKKSFLLIIF
jgi:hypothetical protein